MFVLSHRNRVAARDKSEGTAMIAAKGSADFEHLAESVIHLRCDDEGRASPLVPSTVRLVLAKNRSGPAGISIEVPFDRERQRLGERQPAGYGVLGRIEP